MGRPRSATPKVSLEIKMTVEARQRVEALADAWGLSMSATVERALVMAADRIGLGDARPPEGE